MAAKKTTTKKSGSRKRATSKKASGKTATTKGAQAKPEKPDGKMSALDAAVKVLAEARQAMTCREMIDAMAAKGYWTSPAGQTPDRTLYSDAYRHLGQHIADDVLDRLRDNLNQRSESMSAGQFIRALVGVAATTAHRQNREDVPATPDNELVEWIETLEDPKKDDFEHWYAAHEIAKHHTITEPAIKSLIACCFSKNSDLAAVGIRCLTEVDAPVLPLLRHELVSNSQSRVLKVLDLISAIVQRSSDADPETIDALAGRLNELSAKNRFEKSRIALVQLLGIIADLVGDEFSEGDAYQILSLVRNNDKSRSVRRFAEAVIRLVELKPE